MFPSFPAILLSSCTIALLAITAPAHATGRLADITVYDRNEHRTLPVYERDGSYYVVGRPGNAYQINLRNRDGDRVLAVVSVDAVNVLSGDTAAWDQTGYVLNGGADAEVRGWRKSREQVNGFYFTTLANSYAGRTGRPDNVGVIGVALFRSRDAEEARRRAQAARDAAAREAAANEAVARFGAPAPAAPVMSAPKAAASADRAESSGQLSKSLGTGYGAVENSRVEYTSFNRVSDTPDEVVTIRYDSLENLVAMGVVPPPPVARNPSPDPFPLAPSGHFVPPPPGTVR